MQSFLNQCEKRTLSSQSHTKSYNSIAGKQIARIVKEDKLLRKASQNTSECGDDIADEASPPL